MCRYGTHRTSFPSLLQLLQHAGVGGLYNRLLWYNGSINRMNQLIELMRNNDEIVHILTTVWYIQILLSCFYYDIIVTIVSYQSLSYLFIYSIYMLKARLWHYFVLRWSCYLNAVFNIHEDEDPFYYYYYYYY